MRKIAFIGILISILLFAGCQGDGGTTSSTVSDPWIGGTDGIEISFEEDAPQAEVFDGGDFPFGVVVKLKNEGEFEVAKEDVQITLAGVRAEEFGRTEADLTLPPEDDLTRRLKDTDGRERDSDPVFVDFGDFVYQSSLVAEQRFTFQAEVCYKYQTTANSLICVLKDNREIDERVCTVNEDKEVFSSGAPVQVEGFKESPRAKDKIAFTFTIVHKGEGDIFRQGHTCEDKREFEDRIFVEVNTGLSGELSCSGLRDEGDGSSAADGFDSGYVTLFSGDKPVTCTQQITTNSDYEQPVTIKLLYDYQDRTSTEVLVKHQLLE